MKRISKLASQAAFEKVLDANQPQDPVQSDQAKADMSRCVGKTAAVIEHWSNGLLTDFEAYFKIVALVDEARATK